MTLLLRAEQGVGCQGDSPGNECATSRPGTANGNDLPLVYADAGDKSRRRSGVVGTQQKRSLKRVIATAVDSRHQRGRKGGCSNDPSTF